MSELNKGREMERRRKQAERKKITSAINHGEAIVRSPFRDLDIAGHGGIWHVKIGDATHRLEWRKAKRLINKGLASMT